MSAAPNIAIARPPVEDELQTDDRTYTPGASDAIGDRATHVDLETQLVFERLCLAPEFADAPGFEQAVRASVEAIGRLTEASLSAVLEVGRSGKDGRLTIVSSRANGPRLSELMMGAPNIALAVEVVEEIGPALATLHQAGHVHGVLTPERIVISRDGRPILIEHVLGAAMESLAVPGTRLRTVAGIAVPANHDPRKFGPRLDVIQLGFIVLSVLMGRRFAPSDYPGLMVDQIDFYSRTDPGTAARFRPWLERALQIGDRPFETALDALAAFAGLSEVRAHPVQATPDTTPSDHAASPQPSDESDPPTSEALDALVSGEAEASALDAIRSAMPDQTPEATPESPPEPTPGEKPTLWLQPESEPEPEAEQTPEPDEDAAEQATTATHWPGGMFGVPATPASTSGTSGYRHVALGLGLVVLLQAVVIGQLYVGSLSTDGQSIVIDRSSLAGPADLLPVAPILDGPVRPAEPNGTLPGNAVPFVAQVGGVTLSSAIELQVLQDGQLLGTTGSPIAIAAGTHTLDVVNEAFGYRSRQRVEVTPGQMATVRIAIPKGRININAAPWADVVIDGVEAGQTPLANLELTIGEHEIIFRHPEFGEQRQVATVKVDGVTRVTAVFQQ